MRHYDLGNRIYELRKAKNLSQKELGSLVGVSNKAVSKWENGTAIPKTDTLVLLAEVLDTSPQELLQGKTDNRLTLSQLSSQTNEMFLKEEIEKRDKQLQLEELSFHKRYLAIIIPLFVSIFVIMSVLASTNAVYMEEKLAPYEIVMDSLAVSYVISSAFSGLVFLVRNARRLPCWVLSILSFFFPIVLFFIDFIGVIITPAYFIKSLQGIMNNNKYGQEQSKQNH